MSDQKYPIIEKKERKYWLFTNSVEETTELQPKTSSKTKRTWNREAVMVLVLGAISLMAVILFFLLPNGPAMSNLSLKGFILTLILTFFGGFAFNFFGFASKLKPSPTSTDEEEEDTQMRKPFNQTSPNPAQTKTAAAKPAQKGKGQQQGGKKSARETLAEYDQIGK